MVVRLTNQLPRLSFTRRDLDVIDDEIDRFLPFFIPVIKDTTQSNVGRLFLRLNEGIVDKFNFSVDQKFRQTNLRTVRDLQAAIDITELTRYVPDAVASATVDLTATTLTGPAAPGGIPIPQFSIFTTDTAPVKEFLSLQAVAIPEGAITFFPIPVIEGKRVVTQTIRASATGEPLESIRFPVARTPHDFLEIEVDGTAFTLVEDTRDSLPEDRVFIARIDEDRFTTITFGDGEFGTKLSAGAEVTATYIQSLGPTANTPRRVINKVVGTLAQSISVLNNEIASGGTDGDEVEDIARKAPLEASAFFTASNDAKIEAIAEKVPGVFRALASPGDGAFLNLFIQPDGGGVASSSLLTLVDTSLAPTLIHGMTITSKPLIAASILVDMRVILKKGVTANKSVARRQVFEAISDFKVNGDPNPDGALFFSNLEIGRGFAQSDLDSIVEDVDDGNLVDFVDILTLTRFPTPVKANPSSPDFSGRIVPTSNVGYDDYSIQANTTTTFILFRNGASQGQGTIGVAFTPPEGEITFTLGETTDVFTIGDSYTFRTSAFADNMRLDDFEFMQLERDNDLTITIFFNDEFTIGET